MYPPISKGIVTVNEVRTHLELNTEFGLKVTFNGGSWPTVTVPDGYQDKMCGLCGNWNGNDKDDMKDPNGVLQTKATDFGNSWAVQGEDRKCVFQLSYYNYMSN